MQQSCREVIFNKGYIYKRRGGPSSYLYNLYESFLLNYKNDRDGWFHCDGVDVYFLIS